MVPEELRPCTYSEEIYKISFIILFFMILNTGSRTDIPAFFHKWFLNRVREGFVYSRNPYNGDIYKYNFSPKNVDCMCFCSKNPRPLVKHLDELSEYKQYWFLTINPYGRDVELNVPNYKNKQVRGQPVPVEVIE